MNLLQRRHFPGLILAAAMLSGCGVPATTASGGSTASNAVNSQSLNKVSFTTMYFDDLGYVFAQTYVKRPLGHDINSDVYQIVVNGKRKIASRLVLGNDRGLYVAEGDPNQLPSNPTNRASRFYRLGTWSGSVATMPGTGTEGLNVTFATGVVLKYDAGFGGLDTVILELAALPASVAAPTLYLPTK